MSTRCLQSTEGFEENADDEWETCLHGARTMCEDIPRVFLVDGNKFPMPI